MKIVDAHGRSRSRPRRRRTPTSTSSSSASGSSEEAFKEIFNSDLQKATFGSLPITLILLVLAFGTLVAAGIPLLLAITGVMGTMGIVGGAQPARRRSRSRSTT